jgi:hypothetical protein
VDLVLQAGEAIHFDIISVSESAILAFYIEIAQPASAALNGLMSGALSRDFTSSMTVAAF